MSSKNISLRNLHFHVPTIALPLLLWGFVLYGLYIASISSYLLFHSLAELFSIVVAFTIFLLAWNARKYIANDYLLFISIASLFVAGIDTVHMLAYQGIGIFQESYGANLPTQLWIAARYLHSISFLAAAFFFKHTLNPKFAFAGFTAILTTLFFSIFVWNIFPVCYESTGGLTPFKIVSEYLISLILLCSILILYGNRQNFDQEIFKYFILALIASIGSELAFSIYATVSGLTNFTGHILKTISFILLYQAIIVGGLKQPYNFLFRDLKNNEAILQKTRDSLEHRIQLRTAELAQANQSIIQAYNQTIEGWSLALELRDKETNGHALRVTEMSIRLGRSLGLSEEELLQVRRGALLHDIGKMGIPDSILLKPGTLTEEEKIIMKKHTSYAYAMLARVKYLRPALSIPYCHHEKWDGTGYPNGLKGKSIPLSARLFSVVDVWDALRTDRPYSKAWDEQKVHDHLRALAGSHFDPNIVDHFLTIITR